jgi:hypothetical protein
VFIHTTHYRQWQRRQKKGEAAAQKIHTERNEKNLKLIQKLVQFKFMTRYNERVREESEKNAKKNTKKLNGEKIIEEPKREREGAEKTLHG